MKCPKCGSEYHIGGTDVNGNLVCRACQLKELKECGLLNNAQYPELYSTKTFNSVEPTTAEMLLWLVENTNIGVTKTCMLVNSKTLCWNNETADILAKKGQKAIMVKDLTEAIKQAYDWAKQEEQNAKN